MGTYIIRRLIQSVLIMVGLSVVFFVILHITPGGPCAAYEGSGVRGQAAAQACVQRLGLDKPMVVQYFNQMGVYLHGDLGTSIYGDSVLQTIGQKLPATLLLMGSSYLVQQMIALPLGVFAALRQYTFFDQFFTFISYVGLSMPTFWLGLILIFVFAVHFNWLPAGRVEEVTLPVFWTHDWFVALQQNPGLILGDLLRHLLLPAFVLMVTGIAVDSRFMRGSMLEVIRQDYIRTARAKGLREQAVIIRHALRNALLPATTVMGLQVGSLLGGALLVETVFAWPGIGRYATEATLTLDYNAIMGVTLVAAFIYVIVNLLVDILYMVLDPRISY